MGNNILIFDFQDEDNKRYGNKTIGITQAFAFAFHQGFYSDNQIYKYTHVVPGYNKKGKAIAFKFIRVENNKNRPNGARSINNERHDVVALSFFKKNNIDVKSHAGTYKVYAQNDPSQGKLFYILLDEKDKV